MINLLAGILLGIVLGVSGTVFVVLVWAIRGPMAASGNDRHGEEAR